MIKQFIFKKIVIIPAILIIAVVSYFGLKNGNAGETHTIARGEVVQYVMATGKVFPNQNVELGFDKSGRVGSVNYFVGDSVRRGDVIASLDSGEVNSDISRARAILDEELIKLEELKTTAPASYNDAYRNLEVAIREAFVSADNAVRNRVDQFFKNIPDNPMFEVTFEDGSFVHYFPIPSSMQTSINNDRKSVEKVLKNWDLRISSLDSKSLLTNADLALSDLNKISSFLDNVASAINTFTPAEFQYETTVNNYKTTISLARTEVSGSKTKIVNAKDKLNLAPTLGSDGQYKNVLSQEARVSQARASLASLQATLGKSSIISPFDGVLTKQDAKVGAVVSPGNSLVSITSQSDVYIEANISEINIGKVSEDDRVSVEFDAFPNEVFEGFVFFIEPGDFIIDGVVNFKIRVLLDAPNPKIKNGMTSNLKIETDKRSDVLKVPLYALSREGGDIFVNKKVGKNLEKTLIKIGISGNDSFAEVVEGLNEGDILEY